MAFRICVRSATPTSIRRQRASRDRNSATAGCFRKSGEYRIPAPVVAGFSGTRTGGNLVNDRVRSERKGGSTKPFTDRFSARGFKSRSLKARKKSGDGGATATTRSDVSRYP